jgi:hypothetical protein
MPPASPNPAPPDPAPPAATLTGQDVGEAQGALSGLLERILAGVDPGFSPVEYIALRVLAVRGPARSPAALHALLAGQRQLGLDGPGAAGLLRGLEARGLLTGGDPDGPGPTELTAAGAARYASAAAAVTTLTRRLYADLDATDLATAHRVLAAVTDRANRLRNEL